MSEFTGRAFVSSATAADNDCSADLQDDHPYRKLLEEARESKDSDLERFNCVQHGRSKDGVPILFFAPRLGFGNDLNLPQVQKNRELKRMMLLFIRKANSVVTGPFIMIYAHTPLTILSQQPIIYKYYKMLPREYKKNLLHLYIVHPNFLMRSFFEIGVRWFVSDKFYKKLHFIKTISELQGAVGTNAVQFPPLLIQNEDEEFNFMSDKVVESAQKSHTKKNPADSAQVLKHAPSLVDLFDPALGTTRLIDRCCNFIRSSPEGLKRNSIFRMSGDNVILSAVRRRMASGNVAHYLKIYVGADDPLLVAENETPKAAGAKADSSFTPANIVIDDVDTAANVLKVSLRMWSEPVISMEHYSRLIAATAVYNDTKNEEVWCEAIREITSTMLLEHQAVLEHLMRYLAEVTMESAANNMDAENLARIFSPTLFQQHIDTKNEGNPMAVFAEVTLGAKILRKMIEMHVKKASEKVLSLNEKMINRLTLNGGFRERGLSTIEKTMAAAAEAEDEESEEESSEEEELKKPGRPKALNSYSK